jgi:hypothetical protein
MKITLKSIKYAAFASEETNCYSGTLYVDGKKIGTVSNQGHGACDTFRGDWDAHKKADEWCKANLPKWAAYGDTNLTNETNLEMHCANLLDTFLVTTDVKRAFKTKVLFRKPEGGIYEIKHRGQIAQTIASIIKQNPNADILNNMTVEQAVAVYLT